MKVLFVCTGNICRSPTAEAVFRSMVVDAGLADQIQTDSVGTHGYHVGERPDPRSRQTAENHGYDMVGQTARKLVGQDFEEFDLLLAMDRGHFDLLRAAAPEEALDKLALFLDYATGQSLQDVPDPYYGGADGFENVLVLIEEGCRGVLAAVGKP